MTRITDLVSGMAWRDKLMPAVFRGARFHVETGSRESGRRIVPHEFPKRDVPYAEDMGRKAREFTVRGYIIVYPMERAADINPLHKRNYIPARDQLIKALEEEGPAELQLPLLGVLKVAVTRYRVTEEEKLGGFCAFDMSFVEYGQAPAEGTRQSAAGVYYEAKELGTILQNRIADAMKLLSAANTGGS